MICPQASIACNTGANVLPSDESEYQPQTTNGYFSALTHKQVASIGVSARDQAARNGAQAIPTNVPIDQNESALSIQSTYTGLPSRLIAEIPPVESKPAFAGLFGLPGQHDFQQ